MSRVNAVIAGSTAGAAVCNNQRSTMTDERPVFQHPPWMVGIMLILGVMSLLIGLTIDPFWLVMGSPAILTLVVYIGVRIALRRRFRD